MARKVCGGQEALRAHQEMRQQSSHINQRLFSYSGPRGCCCRERMEAVPYLPLSSRKTHSPLPHSRRVALGEVDDEVVRVGQPAASETEWAMGYNMMR